MSFCAQSYYTTRYYTYYAEAIYSWTQEGGGGDVIEVRGLFLREMLAEKGSNKKGQTPLVVDG